VSNIGNSPLNTERYISDIDEKNSLKEGGTSLDKLKVFKKHFKRCFSENIVSSFFEHIPPSIKRQY